MFERVDFGLLAVFSALLNGGLIYYIFFYLPKNKLTDLFTCSVFALILWQLEDAVVRLTPSLDTVTFWDKVCCIGWVGMAPLAFHFACKLSSLKELTTRFALCILYGPLIIFYTLYVTNPDNSNFIMHESWGWLNVPRAGTFDELQRLWISMVIIAAVIILIRYTLALRRNHDRKYKQARMIALGLLVPTSFSMIFQLVLPLLFDTKEVPLTSISMSVFSVSTLIAIQRYKLFHVSDSVPTDMLMENIEKLILIVSPEKKIIYINKQAADTFGINQDQPEAVEFTNIFSNTEPNYEYYVSEVFNPVLNGAFINNYSSTFLSREGSKINVLITSSLVVNNNIIQGVMLVGSDITELVNAIKALDDERKRKEEAITSAVIHTQEKERMALGCELHDNVNQILASSLLYVNLIKTDKERGTQYLEEMEVLIFQAIEEIRRLSHAMIAPRLNETELMEALDKIIAIASKTKILKIQKEISDIDEKGIPADMKLNIYRIVQEQFNNILKYARAENIHIRLAREGNQLFLSIKDDGIGFDTTTKSDGVGLTNIRSRAALFNGQLHIFSAPGCGCELRIVFDNFEPLPQIMPQKTGAGQPKLENDFPTYEFQLRTA